MKQGGAGALRPNGSLQRSPRWLAPWSRYRLCSDLPIGVGSMARMGYVMCLIRYNPHSVCWGPLVLPLERAPPLRTLIATTRHCPSCIVHSRIPSGSRPWQRPKPVCLGKCPPNRRGIACIGNRGKRNGQGKVGTQGYKSPREERLFAVL